MCIQLFERFISKGLFEDPIMIEERIIHLCQQQDRNAQKLLYEQYDRQMFLLCYRYVGDRHHAEDLVVQGFFKVFKNMHRFENRGPGSLEKWMKTILINECLMFLRKQKRLVWVSESEAEQLPGQGKPDSGLVTDDLYDVIRSLPDGYRTVFNLFALEGYSHKEIAHQLDISEGASKSQLSKARKLLQAHLQQEEIRHGQNIY